MGPVRDLLGNRERRSALANRARTMAMRRYDPDRYARSVENIYLQVAGARPTGVPSDEPAPVSV